MPKSLSNVSEITKIGFKTQSRVFTQKAIIPRIKLILVTLILCLTGSYTLAQWSANPAVNNAISTATNYQEYPTIVSDGSGGAIITWRDYRSGSGDIYAQRINASGVVQWTANGEAICTATNQQYLPNIVSDGSGGAIITWYDYRSGSSYDIYAQRINASGAVQWTANGVVISTATSHQYYPTLVSDGSGGAIITWQDHRSGSSSDIYAQRINASGTVQWTANGVAISTASGNQRTPTIVSDGSGGAIITWHDFRSGTNWDIYAQRINALGVVQWTSDGPAICTASNDQQTPTIVSDGSGGAIITWQDYRSGTNWDIYAQRINASGAVQWTADGTSLCTATNYQENPTIVSDGSGGAIITWHDFRSGTNWDIYAQRINASGSAQWTADGAAISNATNDQEYPTIVSDGAGGAIITWWYRSATNWDIYAQRINASGTAQWTANGVAISTATGNQYYPTLVNDGSGGTIITWMDYRSGSTSDIYVQNVNPNGTLGGCTTSSCAITVTPSTGNYTGGVNTNLYLGYGAASATLASSGGATTIWSPATYLSCATCSSTVFTPTAAGSYTITGINCYDTCTVTICVKDIRVPNTSGTKAAVYMCHLEPGKTTPQTLAVVLRGIPGHFQYHSGDKLGVCGNTCTSTKRDFEVADLVIDEQYLEVMCTPNPFRNSFKLNYVSHLDMEATISIYGMTGNLMETRTLNGVASEAELGNNLPNGIYTVSFNQGDTKKVFRMIKID